MYDSRNRLSFIQRNKKRGLGAVAPPPPFTPPSIPDLNLWFPDFNLQNTGGNTFSWLDEVSKSITISGDYGTGSGLTPVNGYNVLHSIQCNANSVLSNPILNVPEFTFCAFIKQDNPATNGNFQLHYLANNSWAFNFAQYASSGSGGTSGLLSLKHRVFPSTTQYIGFQLFDINNPAFLPFVYTIIYMKVRTGVTPVRELFLNGVQYLDNGLVLPQQSYNVYGLVSGTLAGSHTKFDGQVGEFMYYSRILTNSELNQIGTYYNQKYNIGFYPI